MHARATIGFGFTSDWLKKWRSNFEPINGLSLGEVMQNHSNLLITFDTQLKTTLYIFFRNQSLTPCMLPCSNPLLPQIRMIQDEALVSHRYPASDLGGPNDKNIQQELKQEKGIHVKAG